MQILKKSYFGIIFIIMICCFAGCTNEKKDNNVDDFNDKKETIQTVAQSQCSSVLSGFFYYDKTGMYSLDSNLNIEDEITITITPDTTESYYSLLNFTDDSTNTKVVLCNKPNCKHHDSSCNAFFSSRMTVKNDAGSTRFAIMNSDGYIFLHNDKLYVLDPFGDLFVMDKDGSNHKKLLSIDSKYSINNGFLYKGCIYLCVKYLPTYDGSIEQEFSDKDYNIALLQLNLKSNKCTELFSFKTELETTCLGIYENKSYFFYRSPNTLASANNQQAVDDEKNSHDVCLYYYDLENPKRKYIIKNIKSYEIDDVAFNKNAIYYHNRKEKKIIRLNLDTEEKDDILTNVSGYIEIHTPINDGKLYYTKDNKLTNAFSTETQYNEIYCIDLNTGTVNKVDKIN